MKMKMKMNSKELLLMLVLFLGVVCRLLGNSRERLRLFWIGIGRCQSSSRIVCEPWALEISWSFQSFSQTGHCFRP